MTTTIPVRFVWTKIQADAGQTISLILRRKELERQSGGTFWWGIGRAPKKEKIALLSPLSDVIFSLMPSEAHSRDSDPDGVLLWEQYLVARPNKTEPLPPHAIVISRAHEQNGHLKSSYDALVCENADGIPHNAGGTLNVGSLRNLGGGKLGSSQITAVVEYTSERLGPGRLYPVTARARLVSPFAVKLTAPRLLSTGERRLLDEVSREGKTIDDWMAVANQLRRVQPQSQVKPAALDRITTSPHAP